jgi:hypothetical protein
MFLFFGIILSLMLFSIWKENREQKVCARIDILQLDRRIRAGEIKQLKLRQFDVIATDRNDCNYLTSVADDATRKELLTDANEVVDGRPRVENIVEEKERPIPPPIALGGGLGFIILAILHFGTIVLMMLLMPYYIILAVKNDRLDQTERIIWIVLLCTIGLFANPVYWYLHVWRKHKGEPSTPVNLRPALPAQ